MPKSLKVYRTAIGFHDAYVAAPSKAAALRAWGSERDLFALGAAEVVDEAELTAAPLAAPGQVIKRLRGSAAEQIAALGGDTVPAKPGKPAPVKAKLKPRPRRDRLDTAEAALAAAEARQQDARAGLDAKERAFREERRKLEAKQRAELDRLRATQERAADAYEAALNDWRG